MITIVPSSTFLETVDGELLVDIVEPFGPGRVIREKEPEEKGAQYGNDSFNDEQPPEALEAGGAVDFADTVADGSSEGAGEVAECGDAGYADGAFVPAIPNCDEVDDTCRVRKRIGGSGCKIDVPGKKPASNAPMRKRKLTTVA